jgi:hypothetical protein
LDGGGEGRERRKGVWIGVMLYLINIIIGFL